ncbi:hypothetical protein GCM10010862_48600 [Devosia nitrariae]|uniref:Uncharacterized protein n=1 Tax=Devosia nitrariae TaxID=2071872 RepID=A0ABQ5WDC8_9HYPH|nr:hypothetical protein GCM10010862_48600 [Devosia nitrariae]
MLGVDCALEPVVTGSPKVRLPRAAHPERVTAPTISPAIATTFLDVLRDTQILMKLTRTQVLNTDERLNR